MGGMDTEGTGGLALLRIAYPPTSPPRKRMGGVDGGMAQQDLPVPLKSSKRVRLGDCRGRNR
jgi:hypothetical protein